MKRLPFILGYWMFFALQQFAFYKSSHIGDNFWLAETVLLTGMLIMGATALSIKKS